MMPPIMMHCNINESDRDTGAPLAVLDWSFPGFSTVRSIRTYRRAGTGRAAPVLAVFHDGDFMSGGVDHARRTAEQLVQRLGLVVATPAYTLAGEAPFPTAAEDAYAALRWIEANARQFAGDGQRLAVAGAGAGGNLAAVAALMARDRNGPPLAAQVLVCPLLDPTWTSQSQRVALPNSLRARHACCEKGFRQYLPKASDQFHPYATPMSCSRLIGLPPALIVTEDGDPLRSEAEGYDVALRACGVTSEVVRLPQVYIEPNDLTLDAWGAIVEFLAPRMARAHSSKQHRKVEK